MVMLKKCILKGKARQLINFDEAVRAEIHTQPSEYSKFESSRDYVHRYLKSKVYDPSMF
jgi:hypothetical protein